MATLRPTHNRAIPVANRHFARLAKELEDKRHHDKLAAIENRKNSKHIQLIEYGTEYLDTCTWSCGLHCRTYTRHLNGKKRQEKRTFEKKRQYENEILVARLQAIHGRPKTALERPKNEKVYACPSKYTRYREYAKINEENVHISKRLINAAPVLKSKDFMAFAKQQDRYRNKLLERPRIGNSRIYEMSTPSSPGLSDISIDADSHAVHERLHSMKNSTSTRTIQTTHSNKSNKSGHHVHTKYLPSRLSSHLLDSYKHKKHNNNTQLYEEKQRLDSESDYLSDDVDPTPYSSNDNDDDMHSTHMQTYEEIKQDVIKGLGLQHRPYTVPPNQTRPAHAAHNNNNHHNLDAHSRPLHTHHTLDTHTMMSHEQMLPINDPDIDRDIDHIQEQLYRIHIREEIARRQHGKTK